MQGLAFLGARLDDAQTPVALVADLAPIVADILELVGAALLSGGG